MGHSKKMGPTAFGGRPTWHESRTFYTCTDITFVDASQFNPASVPCFNATDSENDVPPPTTTGTPTNLPDHGED
ncbi:uncharacterized protein CTHT_0027520 [Thermochaetoides thermophila DSM 1495]|uniref:Uncharacterized protein n=1 Tax=Chaetomium thermophilum (strain DSM 1495 / CBS 144.50 / IMI 039719) TaxID=759272 RepID=G0S758_CHATD|nr:hypothetical protein CTHT_0027520 [Thermochaetoides thermophila DSM 1495]EGS20913.1 hypothetical protein CTHT_0027520 [Thermochaetoides thermophila DSM 1495]